MRRILLVLFCCLSLVGYAGTELGKAPEPLGDFNVVRVPLKLAGNLILIEAQVDGETGFFILDTGAPYLVLNRTYFSDARVSRQQIMNDITGVSDTVNIVEISNLSLRALQFGAMEADVTDLGSIENKRGVKILGLMGLNLFLKLEMHFDLQRGVLELHRIDKNGDRLSGAKSCDNTLSELEFKLRNNVMLLKGSVAEKNLSFCFDTGAEVAVIANDLSNKVYDQLVVEGAKNLIGSSGESIQVLFGRFPMLTVGKDLKNCRVVVTDLGTMRLAYGAQIDGMIGFDLLANGPLTINFQKRLISFCSS